MSNDDYLRRRTEEQVRNNPGTQKLTDQQANYHDRTVVNNEIDRLRREREQAGRS